MRERTLVTLTITIDVDEQAADVLDYEGASYGSHCDPPVSGMERQADAIGWIIARLAKDMLDVASLDPGAPDVRVSLAHLDPSAVL